jgi:phospholipase/carboxylesterase
VTATLDPPVVARGGSTDRDAPLVVLFHGRNAREHDMLSLAEQLPVGPAYVAVRGPVVEAEGPAWFASRGIGRPVADSLTATMAWFRHWLGAEAPTGPVVLIGYSGGATFAGGLALDDPAAFAGAAILHGAIPFEAGPPTTRGRLHRMPVFVAQGARDAVIPRDLRDRTWAYLTDDAGALTTAFRDPGGHGLSAATLSALAHWVADVTGAGHPTLRPDDHVLGEPITTMASRRVVVGVDGSDESLAALSTVAELADKTHAGLLVVHVRDETNIAAAVGRGGADVAIREALDTVEADARRRVSEILRPWSMHWGFDTTAGDAAQQLIAAARRHRAEAIVVGGRSHGVIGGLVLGSVAQKLVRQSPISVLVVRGGNVHPTSPRPVRWTGGRR